MLRPTMRQMVAVIRRELRYLGRGGRIKAHQRTCATRRGRPCNCRIRFWLVKAPPKA